MRYINSFGFRFEWRASGGEWCGWPTNTISQASSSSWVCNGYSQVLNVAMEHSLEFSIINVMNMQSFMNKMSISNINKHHQKTINSYLHNVIRWKHRHEIIYLFVFNSIVCDIVSIFFWSKKSLILNVSSLCIQNDILHWNKPFSWKTSITPHLRPKCHIMQNKTIRY